VAVAVGLLLHRLPFLAVYVYFNCLFIELVLVEGQHGHTTLLVPRYPLVLCLVAACIFLLSLFLKIAVGQFYVFDDLLDGSRAFLSPAPSCLQLALVPHLPPDELVLQPSDIFLVILNYLRNVLLEYPGEFLMVLVVLAQQCYLIGELMLLVVSSEVGSGIVEGDVVLEES
jgi:hypothetical protein